MRPNDMEVPQIVSAPKPNSRNIPTMFTIFQNVQYNIVQHKKYVKELIKLYKKTDQDLFRESFKNALQYLFTFGDTSANVDRVVQFVATFCTSLDDEEEFLLFIFEIIFDCQCVSGQSVRYRASQLLAAVLSALGDDASLDDDLCDKLLRSQMTRLQDTRGAVRCRAALALQRLQNPTEPDDEVTKVYRFHMCCDPSSSVRRAIVMSIAKSTRNVPFVLERICDVDEAVRRAAFLYIAAINVSLLKVRQRVLVLKVGLTERSQRVKRVVEEILIPSWLSTFKGNIVDLLKAIRLDNAHDARDSQHVASKLLESLFKRLPISELLEWLPTDKNLRLIPAEKLNKETAWYWRHLAEHLQNIDDDETLETVLPDLVVLVGYIRAILQSPCPSETDDPVGFGTRQYVLQELGCMLRVYDASDATGRSALQDLITDALTGDYGPLNAEVLRAFVSALELVVPEVSPRMEVIYAIISSLRDPPEPEILPIPALPTVEPNAIKLQKARLRVSLNVAMEAQEEAVREQNYSAAAKYKAEVEEIQRKLEELNMQTVPEASVPVIIVKEKLSDADTLNKCLIILNAALDTPQLKTITPTLQMIFKELEIEILQDPEVRNNALETVALYGMLDKDFAKENKSFVFTQLMADSTNEPLVATALRCIVDLLCVHGVRIFEDNETESKREESRVKGNKSRSISTIDDEDSISDSLLTMTPNHNYIIEILLNILNEACAAYRLIIVEGLCRLMYLGHLESPVILSRLLLMWFNPATSEEDMLRQTIGVFFQTFPITVDGAQEQIQKATWPTLRTLANAPLKSPLSQIDQEAVVRFIVSLTRVNHELVDSQGGMALCVCRELCRRPRAPEAALACRLLALLSPPRDAHVAVNLAVTLRDLVLKLPDKQSCRNLTRYLGALELMERSIVNKISNTGITEGTLPTEDTIGQISRATSLPQPLARSTHVVVNETVEEEVEIDETSPSEPMSNISEEQPIFESTSNSKESEGPLFKDNTTIPCAVETVEQISAPEAVKVPSSTEDAEANEFQSDDSSGISPEKKAKVTKGKKNKKKSIGNNVDTKVANKKKDNKKKPKERKQDKSEKGVKRTRSQRSLVDIDRAKEIAVEKKTSSKEIPSSSPYQDLDDFNVTVRRSTRAPQTGSSSDSNSSPQSIGSKKTNKKNKPAKNINKGNTRVTRSSSASARDSAGSSEASVFEHSADETELHTIVYDQEIQQSLLNDSSELFDSAHKSKEHVTIPETPEDSEESESELKPQPTKAKEKRNGKKK